MKSCYIWEIQSNPSETLNIFTPPPIPSHPIPLQDPLDAAVYYLAMKKKSLVWGLYRSVKDERMTTFFANDFSQDRWRKAALKNAFALLGKQRFLHAAAFFLLSGSLKDALDICVDKLDDLQLAMVISRLYEGEMQQVPDSLRALLHLHILGRTKEVR